MDKPGHRPVGEGAGHRRFLTFRIAADFYALPADEVAEVVRVPAVTRVPHAPPSLMGIGNLRGSPIPVASLRALLGYEDAEDASRARAIVLSGPAPVALTVDFVDTLVGIGADELKDARTSGLARPGERLKGCFGFTMTATSRRCWISSSGWRRSSFREPEPRAQRHPLSHLPCPPPTALEPIACA